MNPKEVVIEFNNCINNRDINGLEQLMTEDHSFIDSENNVMSGKVNCLNAWKGFFQGFPDYKNIFQTIRVNNDDVVITGHSVCSAPVLQGPAIWSAKIENSKIAEWRVYEDSSKNRQLLGLNDD